MSFPAVLDNVVTDALDWVGTFSYETVARIERESYQGLAERAPGSPALVIFTERFAGERLKAAAQASGAVEKKLPEVLFVCANNAGRSVMAAVYPGKRYVDWAVDDPVGRPVEEVRRIRDDIDQRVRTLLAELVGGGPEAVASGR